MEAWKQWLMQNDARVRARGIEFAEKIATGLIQRSYFEPEDLDGVCLDKETVDALNEMERGVIARHRLRLRNSPTPWKKIILRN